MDTHSTTTATRSVWLRALFMLLGILAYQVSVTLLFILSFIQFLFVFVTDAPNGRIASFGLSLGEYLRQIVHYLSFATDRVPFPLSEWPDGH